MLTIEPNLESLFVLLRLCSILWGAKHILFEECQTLLVEVVILRPTQLIHDLTETAYTTSFISFGKLVLQSKPRWYHLSAWFTWNQTWHRFTDKSRRLIKNLAWWRWLQCYSLYLNFSNARTGYFLIRLIVHLAFLDSVNDTLTVGY